MIWKLVNGEWRNHVDIFNSNVNPQAPASVDGSSIRLLSMLILAQRDIYIVDDNVGR